MTQTEQNDRRPRQIDELEDVYDYLDEVRLRPGIYVRGSSIFHLDSVLYGYRLACEINGIPSTADFEPGGPFTKWLGTRLDLGYESSLGWSAEIERAAEAADTPPLDLFFGLLDEFRAEHDPAAR